MLFSAFSSTIFYSLHTRVNFSQRIRYIPKFCWNDNNCPGHSQRYRFEGVRVVLLFSLQRDAEKMLLKVMCYANFLKEGLRSARLFFSLRNSSAQNWLCHFSSCSKQNLSKTTLQNHFMWFEFGVPILPLHTCEYFSGSFRRLGDDPATKGMGKTKEGWLYWKLVNWCRRKISLWKGWI